MARKRSQDISKAFLQDLRRLRMDLCNPPELTATQKWARFEEFRTQHGERAGSVAFDLITAYSVDANASQTFISGVMTVNDPKASGPISQSAGRDMIGVNASGTQKIRDITTYSQDLDQTGATINAPLRQALIEAREELDKTPIEPELKPMVIENYDKLTNEIKKGKAANPGLVKGLWTMVSSAVGIVPGAVKAGEALKKVWDKYQESF